MWALARLYSLWVGNELPPLEWSCLHSLAKAGHDLTLFTYDEIEAVPPGVTRADAELIMPRHEVFSNRGKRVTFAGFSNVFRYRLLSMNDGVWVDCDLVSGGKEWCPSTYEYGWEDSEAINTAVLGLPRDSELLQELIASAESRSKQSFTWGQLGPKLFSELASGKPEVLARAKPSQFFYSLHYSSTWKLFHPGYVEEIQRLRTDSVFVHLWSNVIKNAPPAVASRWPPAGSFLDYLYRDAGLEKPVGKRTPLWMIWLWALRLNGRRFLRQKWRAIVRGGSVSRA